MVKDWVFADNLRPLVETLSALAGSRFQQSEWDMVQLGLAETDVELDAWIEYELSGENRIDVALALDPGTSVAFVRVQASEQIESKVDAMIERFQTLEVAP